MINIYGIPAFSDNYIWCIYDDESRQAIVVDPGSYEDTVEYLVEKELNLAAILITHHHPDHTGGVAKLKSKFKCSCIASTKSKTAHTDVNLENNKSVELLGLEFLCIDLPGHTLDHNAYYCEELNALFCGDTLFSGGCGRLFEGSAEQMYNSLEKIRALPSNTNLYCAHEYTLANLEFAIYLMPNNELLKRYTDSVKQKRAQNIPSIPSSLQTELDINPFLRSDDEELVASIQSIYPDTEIDRLAIFTATRAAKDNF